MDDLISVIMLYNQMCAYDQKWKHFQVYNNRASVTSKIQTMEVMKTSNFNVHTYNCNLRLTLLEIYLIVS